MRPLIVQNTFTHQPGPSTTVQNRPDMVATLSSQKIAPTVSTRFQKVILEYSSDLLEVSQ